VRGRWSELCGLDSESLTTADETTFNRLFNRWARRGWNWFFWAVLTPVEERYFRAEWAAGDYAADAEVRYGDPVVYYRASVPCTAADVPGVSTSWEVISNLDAYIAYVQAGETPIGTFKSIHPSDPRGQRNPRKLPFVPDDRGAMLVGETVPTSVWVRYRLRCPEWTGATYSASTAYAAGKTRYYASTTEGFEGDYWLTVAATDAGQSPETHPAKWSRIEIPKFLEEFAAHGAHLDWQRGEEQTSKAIAEESPCWAWLYDERDKEQNQGGNVRRVGFTR